MKGCVFTTGMERSTCCCFAGIQPERIRRPVDDIKVDLENEILWSIQEGYTVFLTGLAYETDIWAGKIIIRLREDRFPELQLIAAVPFPDHRIPNCEPEYEDLCSHANRVLFSSRIRDESAYQKRNKWMVDHSNSIIAVFDGRCGDVLQYASKIGLNTILVDA